MAYPKLTGFMIAFVVVSMFAGLFSLLLIEGHNNYSFSEGKMNISKYNRLTEVSNSVDTIKADTLGVKQQSGVFDLVGGFFSNSWKVITAIPQNFQFFDDMTQQAMDDTDAGAGFVVIRNALETIVIILLVIGILLAALIKWVL